MTSQEKIRQALDMAESLADTDSDVSSSVRTAATILALARGHLEQMIPADDELLDAYLARGAAWMLSLRSDDAPALLPVQLLVDTPE